VARGGIVVLLVGSVLGTSVALASAVRGRPEGSAPPDTAAAVRLLAKRGAAVVGKDRGAFLSGVAPAARPGQARLFTRLGPVPLASWTYTLGRRVPCPPGTPVAGWCAAATLAYAFAGLGEQPVRRARTLAFVPDGGGWQLLDDRPAQPDLWDGGPVATVTGRTTLALGRPAQLGQLTELADESDRAAAEVTRSWGPWPQRVVLLLPDSAAELPSLARASDATHLAAASEGPMVALNPAELSRLSPVGRQVVLIHEITHVASMAATTSRTPLWLVEGLADDIGFAGTGLPATTVAAELAQEVRAGRMPAALPTAADFTPSSRRLAQAYQEAWLACRLIVDRAGASGLVRLYQLAGRPGTTLDAALIGVLGTGLPGFTAEWRDYLARQLR
jgi:hypothetical protein